MTKAQPKLVHIIWRDPQDDWPWFWLIGKKEHGTWLHLKGAHYPDGSARHAGDSFWAHVSEIETIRNA